MSQQRYGLVQVDKKTVINLDDYPLIQKPLKDFFVCTFAGKITEQGGDVWFEGSLELTRHLANGGNYWDNGYNQQCAIDQVFGHGYSNDVYHQRHRASNTGKLYCYLLRHDRELPLFFIDPTADLQTYYPPLTAALKSRGLRMVGVKATQEEFDAFRTLVAPPRSDPEIEILL